MFAEFEELVLGGVQINNSQFSTITNNGSTKLRCIATKYYFFYDAKPDTETIVILPQKSTCAYVYVMI